MLILSEFGNKLVDQYFVRVHRYVRMKVCEADCEDVIHDIFLRAIEREDQVKEDTGAWLFAIARSQVAEYYRRRSVRDRIQTGTNAEIEEAPASRASDISPLEKMEVSEFHDLLRRKLSLLSEVEQDVISFKFTDGLSNIRIAQILNLKVNNLGVILHRALGRLKAAMLDDFA